MSDAAQAAAFPVAGEPPVAGVRPDLGAEEISALSVLGHTLLVHRRFDEARALFEALTEVAPEQPYAYGMLVYAHLESGACAAALEAIERYRRLGALDTLAETVIAHLESRALWGLGREEEARERLADYLDMVATS